MNVATYLAKNYGDNGCWLLVADVYAIELGMQEDERREYRTICNSAREIARVFDLELRKGRHGFARVQDPVDFAVAMLGRSERLGIEHCGVYYQGKVLHACPGGNLYQDLASLGDVYPVMKFWAK